MPTRVFLTSGSDFDAKTMSTLLPSCTHTPLTHVGVFIGQTLPQAPQFLASRVPSMHTLLQFSPGEPSHTHTPALQTDPTTEQALPQPPQLFGSVVMSFSQPSS